MSLQLNAYKYFYWDLTNKTVKCLPATILDTSTISPQI